MTNQNIAAPAAKNNPAAISKALILAELRVQSARARLFQHEMDTIGLALTEGVITPAIALVRMRDAGAVLICDQQPGDTVNSGAVA
jgi:hypothetical protein